MAKRPGDYQQLADGSFVSRVGKKLHVENVGTLEFTYSMYTTRQGMPRKYRISAGIRGGTSDPRVREGLDEKLIPFIESGFASDVNHYTRAAGPDLPEMSLTLVAEQLRWDVEFEPPPEDTKIAASKYTDLLRELTRYLYMYKGFAGQSAQVAAILRRR